MTAKFQQEKQSAENGAVDYLISSGLNNRDSREGGISLKIYLSESQERKVEEYCRVFGVSVRTMLNSCIQYVIFLSEKKGVEVKDLRYYPKRLGSSCHDLLLNAETLSKLKNSGVNKVEEAGKYAVAGIKVLHEKNLNIRSKKSSKKKL
ncbi:MAG: hypothetical protein SNJ50_15685 [Cyanobacteriota bacterium]